MTRWPAGLITAEQAAAMKERLAARKAMEQLVADGVASGKTTQEQASLIGGRALGGPMMDGRGPMGSGPGSSPNGACGEGEGGRGRR